MVKDEDNYYILMEYIKGGTLLDLINERKKEDKPITTQEISEIMKNIMDGLIYIHNANIVHRDLKLENILLKDKKDITSITFIDFGI